MRPSPTRKLKLSPIPSPKYFASGRWQATIRKYPACLPSMTIFSNWLNRAVLSFVVSISKKATYSSKIRNCGASHCPSGSRFFGNHTSQLLSMKQPFDTVVSVTVVEKNDQCTNTRRYQNRNGIVGSPCDFGMEQVKSFQSVTRSCRRFSSRNTATNRSNSQPIQK